MEVREWAEAILLSKSLTDKKKRLVDFSDDRPVSSYTEVLEPGRPDFLVFSPKRKAFPGLHEMEKDRVRGEILHFFANHELLALELMAYALLKFPKAPTAFRKGLVQAMREEQEHLDFYLQNMERLGVGFGEVPVSDFFWKSISQMKTPYDFVCNMSLCFEQANLDYAKYYENAFRKIEDVLTADALHQVYLDEIKHVNFGYQWFKKWKGNGSEWEEHKKALFFPLTPRRAKGIDFDEEVRKKIGFEQSYIDQLKVFESSRGKLPKLYIFNPMCEKEVLKENLSKVNFHLMEDLSLLMMLFTNESDILQISQKPSIAYLNQWQKVGLPVCSLLSEEDANKKRIEARIYWGEVQKNKDLNKIFYSKKNPIYLLDEIYKKLNGSEVLPSREQLLQNYEKEKMSYPYVLKQEFASAGSGIFVVKTSQEEEKAKSWVQKKKKLGHQILVEKWWMDKTDISFHFDRKSNGQIKYVGWTVFETSKSGKYESTYLHAKDFPLRDIEKKENGFYQKIISLYIENLEKHLKETKYIGPIGIDALIIRDRGGVLFHPMMDLNIRFTMGRVAKSLEKYILPSCKGVFSIKAKEKDQNFSFEDWVEKKKEDLLFERGKIKKGFFPLQEPNLCKSFLPYIEVSQVSATEQK